MSILKPAQIFDLVEKLTADVQYSVSSVERILGPIGLKSEPANFNKSFDFYKARCDGSEWLEYVELRVPIPSRPSTRRLLIVKLKEGVGREIGYEQIVLHYGEEDEYWVPVMHAPPEDPDSLVYLRDWGKLIFGITRDFEELVGIYIHVD